MYVHEKIPEGWPPLPQGWPIMLPGPVKYKLSVLDLIVYDNERVVRMLWEVCRVVFQISLHHTFSCITLFIQIKMYKGVVRQEEAEGPLKKGVLGNRREGVLKIGGGTCVGGVVSN